MDYLGFSQCMSVMCVCSCVLVRTGSFSSSLSPTQWSHSSIHPPPLPCCPGKGWPDSTSRRGPVSQWAPIGAAMTPARPQACWCNMLSSHFHMGEHALWETDSLSTLGWPLLRNYIRHKTSDREGEWHRWMSWFQLTASAEGYFFICQYSALFFFFDLSGKNRTFSKRQLT